MNYNSIKKKKRKNNRSYWDNQLTSGLDFKRSNISNHLKEIEFRRGNDLKDVPKEDKYYQDLYDKYYKESTATSGIKAPEKADLTKTLKDIASIAYDHRNEIQNNIRGRIENAQQDIFNRSLDYLGRHSNPQARGDPSTRNQEIGLLDYSDIGRFNPDEGKHDFETDDNLSYAKLQNLGLNVTHSRNRIPQAHQGRLLPVKKHEYGNIEYKNVRKSDLSTIYGGDKNLNDVESLLGNLKNFYYNNDELKAPSQEVMRDDPAIPKREPPLNPRSVLEEGQRYFNKIQPSLYKDDDDILEQGQKYYKQFESRLLPDD